MAKQRRTTPIQWVNVLLLVVWTVWFRGTHGFDLRFSTWAFYVFNELMGMHPLVLFDMVYHRGIEPSEWSAQFEWWKPGVFDGLLLVFFGLVLRFNFENRKILVPFLFGGLLLGVASVSVSNGSLFFSMRLRDLAVPIVIGLVIGVLTLRYAVPTLKWLKNQWRASPA